MTLRSSTLLALVTPVMIGTALLGAPAPATAQVERIAAVVNDEIVSRRDVQSRLRLVIGASGLPNNQQTQRRLLPQVLRALIDERVQLQEAERIGIEVTESDINVAKGLMEERNNIPSGSFDQFFERAGLDAGSAVDQMRAQIAWTKLVRRRFSSVAAVSTDEVNERLDQIQQSIGKPQTRVREILLTVDDADQEAQTQQLAARLADEVRGGGSFATLAREFSRGANASVGGDIGYVTPGQLPEELDTVVSDLEPGEVSDPIRTVFGYHVLLVTDRRVQSKSDPMTATVTLKQVFLPLRQDAPAEEEQSQLSVAQAVSDAAEGCTDIEALAQEVGSPVGADLGTFKVGELSPDLRKTVVGLDVGRASTPVRLPTGLMVLMICERVEPESNLPTADQVREELLNRKLETLARRYLRDLRRAAFIETRV